MIQHLLDTAGPTCVIPPGVHDVPEGTRLTVPNGVERIIGDGATVRVVDANGAPSTAVPTVGLFNCGLRPASRLEVRGLTIVGPDTTGWDQNTDVPYGAVEWVHAKTWASTLIIDGVTISGGYGYGVYRAGGGRLDVHNSILSGWVGGLACFESHNGTGSVLVRNTALCAPARSKHSSIGAYLHPHLDVTWDNVTATGWNRFACYLNGSPTAEGSHTLVDVTATDCSLIQTASSSQTTLVRCVEQGTPRNGGSVLKGPVLSVGSRWSSEKPVTVMSGNAPERRFVGDRFDGPGYWLSCGGTTAGTVEAVGCTFDLGPRASALQVTNRSTVAAEFTSCEFTGATRWTVNVEGGSVRFVDMDPPTPVRVVAPGVML